MFINLLINIFKGTHLYWNTNIINFKNFRVYRTKLYLVEKYKL